MKAEKLENYPIEKREISKQNHSKEGAGNYSNLKVLMKIWAYDNIVREIWVTGFTGRVVFFEGDSARVGNFIY